MNVSFETSARTPEYAPRPSILGKRSRTTYESGDEAAKSPHAATTMRSEIDALSERLTAVRLESTRGLNALRTLQTTADDASALQRRRLDRLEHGSTRITETMRRKTADLEQRQEAHDARLLSLEFDVAGMLGVGAPVRGTDVKPTDAKPDDAHEQALKDHPETLRRLEALTSETKALTSDVKTMAERLDATVRSAVRKHEDVTKRLATHHRRLDAISYRILHLAERLA